MTSDKNGKNPMQGFELGYLFELKLDTEGAAATMRIDGIDRVAQEITAKMLEPPKQEVTQDRNFVGLHISTLKSWAREIRELGHHALANEVLECAGELSFDLVYRGVSMRGQSEKRTRKAGKEVEP